MSSRSRCISSRSLPQYNRILPDWVPAQKGDRARCAENYPGPATQKGCLTTCQELSRQRVGLASLDNSDTHDGNAGRGPASTYVRRPVHRHGRRGLLPCAAAAESYKLHIGGFSKSLQDWRRRAAASVEDRSHELQATQWRLWWRTGDAARRHW